MRDFIACCAAPCATTCARATVIATRSSNSPFRGDIIGFGNLEAHISTAQAMVGTEVSLITLQDFAEALKTDAQLSARVAAAIDREFYYLRNRAIQSAPQRRRPKLDRAQ